MPIYYENFFAAVTRHFVGGFLQQFQLHLGAIRQGSGLVLRFENLAVEVGRKNNGIFFVGRVFRDVAHIDQVRSQRQLRAMFFNNAKGQQAGALALS